MRDRYTSQVKRAIETRLAPDCSLSALARETGISKGRLSKLRRGLVRSTSRERAALGIAAPRPRGVRVRLTLQQAEALVGMNERNRVPVWLGSEWMLASPLDELCARLANMTDQLQRGRTP